MSSGVPPAVRRRARERRNWRNREQKLAEALEAVDHCASNYLAGETGLVNLAIAVHMYVVQAPGETSELVTKVAERTGVDRERLAGALWRAFGMRA